MEYNVILLVVVLLMYHLFLLYNILKRRQWISICFDYRQIWISARRVFQNILKRWQRTSIGFDYRQTLNSARRVFQNQQRADIFRKETAVMTQIVVCYAASSLVLFIFGAENVYGDHDRRPFAIAIIVFAGSAFLFFIGTISSHGKANLVIDIPVDELDIENPESYKEELEELVERGLVCRHVGYRLFYATFALMTGWTLGPIPMLLATILLVLYLYIEDSSHANAAAAA